MTNEVVPVSRRKLEAALNSWDGDAVVTEARAADLLEHIWNFISPQPTGCGHCARCVPNFRFMRLCPTCGNKRCPHASDHNYECTGSNEPGQEGSVYKAWTPSARQTDTETELGCNPFL